MRKLVLTSRFKRYLRKFIKHDQNLQARIEETLQQMETDLFAANLATHQLEFFCLNHDNQD
jgi:mRNA-degrading endonuclease YafQ of YafQ-DinJ toxin-antitoxin module